MERMLADLDQFRRKVASFDATPTTVSPPDPSELLERAGTSRTAAKELQIRAALAAAMDQLKRVTGGCLGSKDLLPALADVLSGLAHVYTVANNLPRFPPAQRDRLVAAAERVIKGDPSHEGARVVWAGLHFYEGWASAYLQQCCYDFPESPFFFKLHGWRLAEDGKWVEAAHKYAKALQLCPDDLDALYSLAAVRRMSTEQESRDKQLETIGLYQQFLSRCEPDHPKAPEGACSVTHTQFLLFTFFFVYYLLFTIYFYIQKITITAHYGVGAIYLVLDDMEKVRKHYLLGLDAEKKQLPMFLPYTSLNRDCLALVVNAQLGSQASSGPSPGGVRPSTSFTTSTSCFLCLCLGSRRLISVPQAPPPPRPPAARGPTKRGLLMCGAASSGCVSVSACALRAICGSRA
jgi:tetratricopeptide (TPR) repeat protein